MQLSDFHFDLPPALIAQEPLPMRSASKMLVLEGPQIRHRHITDLPFMLHEGDLLVFNNTRVIAARMFGQKPSGGKLELLIERVTGECEVLTKIRASKALKPGGQFEVAGVGATVIGRQEDLFRVEFALPTSEKLDDFIERCGQLPLPPYIDRPPGAADAERYQTIYADKPGAVAAPTAGLHFDDAIFANLKKQGVEHTFITLHVGAGTFMPVRENDIAKHVMHPERVSVSQEAVDKILQTKQRGRRVVAVGTTCVRSLEAAAAITGTIQAFNGETDLFLTPGSKFNVIDGMLTNFHLPESTLLMLVSAFGGYENTMQAYEHAVLQQYRFFSYGDAMLVWPPPKQTEDA
jgi:S-adenosylmethionine:tRNA ribosyltransferase-isomerase